MFKVLVIAYYFPPAGLSGVQRTLKFVKYFPANNWKPTVITTDSIGYFAHDLTLLEDLRGKEIDIVRVKGKDINSRLAKKGTVTIPNEFIRKVLSKISSTIFIPDNKKNWSKKVLKVASELMNREQYDLIFVSGPPFSTVNTAVALKKKFKVPLVIDYRDLWYGFHFATYPTPYHSYKIKKMEYKALREADKVIVINRRIKEKLMDYYKFLTFKDIVIIPQGYDPEDLEKAISEKKMHDKMILTYSGLFYENITPKYFLQAFRQLLNERPDIANSVLLYFIGVKRKEVPKVIKKLKLENFVKEFGYIPHLDALSKVMLSDVLWLMIGEGKNADTISSGKFFEYIGTMKPVIGCVPEGTLKTNLEEYGAAFICAPDDITSIKQNIIKAFQLYKKGELPKANEEYVQKHRRDALTEILVKEFQFLLKEK